jgi:hypothetical protein
MTYILERAARSARIGWKLGQAAQPFETIIGDLVSAERQHFNLLVRQLPAPISVQGEVSKRFEIRGGPDVPCR